MMRPIKLLENVFWVGAIDWNVRHFHGFTYSTHRGTTYNAYLIVDEKTALIDTVYAPFAREMIDKIQEIIDPSQIDYIVTNHVETDHSGALSQILKSAPRAQLIGTAQCKAGLQKHYFSNWDFHIVNTGNTLSLGRKQLQFIKAPMLHWPDSMFTYLEEDGLLLPNDAFGQHLASLERFDDEVDEHILMDEATKYYANILWPLSKLVIKKIEELLNLGLPINMIAPSHGIIWRSNPTKIIEAYLRWARGDTRSEILVVYDTMWSSTETMAKAILTGIHSMGVKATLYRLPLSDQSDIFKELLEARGIVIGSSTINNGILPTLAPFLEEIKGFKPANKIAAAFGSYGWSGGATKTIEETLEQAGLDLVTPALTVKWVPDNSELMKCVEFGREIAKHV